MRKIRKKLAAVLLAAVMIVTLVPMLGMQPAYALDQVSFDLGSSVHGITWDASQNTYMTEGSYCWFVADDLYEQDERMMEAYFEDSSPTVNVWPVDPSLSQYNINDIDEKNGRYEWNMPEGSVGKAFRLVLFFDSVVFESEPFVVGETITPVTAVTINFLVPEVGETSAWQGSIISSVPEAAFQPSDRFDLEWKEYDTSGNYVGVVTGQNGKIFQAGYTYELDKAKVSSRVRPGYALVSGTIVFFYENDELVPVRAFTLSYDIAASAKVSGIDASYPYTGSAIKPVPVVKYGGKTLNAGIDYTVSYANNKNAGKATVKITGTGIYSGTVKKTFQITPKAITPKVTLSASSYTWDGKAKKPSVTVKAGSKTLPTSDYKVTYASGRTNVGKYNVKVTLRGNYTGAKTVKFTIDPKGTSLKTLTAASKAITVKWAKQATKMSSARITGYQIQVATDSKFTKNKKTVTVKGYSTVSNKVTELIGGKKYYVRIRTYMKVDGANYYSGWSKAKAVTTK